MDEHVPLHGLRDKKKKMKKVAGVFELMSERACIHINGDVLLCTHQLSGDVVVVGGTKGTGVQRPLPQKNQKKTIRQSAILEKLARAGDSSGLFKIGLVSNVNVKLHLFSPFLIQKNTP